MIAAPLTHEAKRSDRGVVGYRPDIDGLRAVAVLLVIVFHAFPTVLGGGYVGVDIFFVISGYLITGIVLRDADAGAFTFRRFYSRRVTRIFPALAVTLCGTLLIGWVVLSPTALAALGHLAASSAAFVPNITLWHQAGYFDQTAYTKPLLHLWSLGIEEQFYFVWPLFLVVCLRRRHFVLPAIGLVTAASFVMGLQLLKSDPTGAYYLPWARAWELGIGAILAATRPSWANRTGPAFLRGRSVAAYLGLILILVASVLLNSASTFPGWAALLPTAGAALVIASSNTAVNRALSSRWFVTVGVISYPLYLWHWPLLSFAYLHYHGFPDRAVRIAMVGAAFVLALLTHRLVERPLKMHVGSRLTTALIVVMALIGGFGYTTAAADGFVKREDDALKVVLAYSSYDASSDGARVGSCWLSVQQNYSEFDSECSTQQSTPGILVWGDSHAARLFVGVRSWLGPSENIGQLTRNSCAPILDYQLPSAGQCQSSNTSILDSVRLTKPSTVLLFADWSTYSQDWALGSAMAARLTKSLSAIAAAGVGEIVVVGPAPKWTPDLPTIIYDDWNRQLSPQHLPQRLATGLDTAVQQVDADMSAVVKASGAEFVSLLDFLCNQAGCLTSIPGSPQKLLTWDYGHLTTDGARYVAQHMSTLGVLGA